MWIVKVRRPHTTWENTRNIQIYTKIRSLFIRHIISLKKRKIWFSYKLNSDCLTTTKFSIKKKFSCKISVSHRVVTIPFILHSILLKGIEINLFQKILTIPNSQIINKIYRIKFCVKSNARKSFWISAQGWNNVPNLIRGWRGFTRDPSRSM